MKQNKIYLVVGQYKEFSGVYRVVGRPQFLKNLAIFEAIKYALKEKENLKQLGYTNLVLRPENDYLKVIADGILIKVYYIVKIAYSI